MFSLSKNNIPVGTVNPSVTNSTFKSESLRIGNGWLKLVAFWLLFSVWASEPIGKIEGEITMTTNEITASVEFLRFICALLAVEVLDYKLFSTSYVSSMYFECHLCIVIDLNCNCKYLCFQFYCNHNLFWDCRLLDILVVKALERLVILTIKTWPFLIK